MANNLDAEAAAWAVRLEADDLNEAEREALEAWLARDSRCVGALVRAQSMWADLDRVVALDTEGELRMPPSRWHVLGGRVDLRWAALAASTLVAAVLGLGTYDYYDGRVAATKGEIRRVTLEDGSSMILNSSSVVQVRFQKDTREVLLRQGEASFQVAADKGRPFIVRAGDLAVRATGTNFAVRLQPQQVSVIVDEGAVQVQRADLQLGDEQTVTRNQSLVADTGKRMKQVRLSEQDIQRRLAWRDGMLIFNGERLAEAATEVNRYALKPIIIDDRRLAEKAFVGAFRVGDAKTFADSVVAAYGARLSERNDAYHLAVR